MTLSRREFERIRSLARLHAGLDLREGKEGLVSARLGKKVRQGGFRNFQQYCDHVAADTTGKALAEMIDALTTNHTMFLREPAHFDFLRRIASAELRGPGPIRIWSAACSTGEEPYSIAICLLEELGPQAASRIRILASDISTRALQAAKDGIYAAERFEGFPAAWLPRYFLRGEGNWKGWYRVKPELRRMLEFRRINLMEPFTGLPSFDVVFCRNVMIYFDRPTREDVVRRITALIEPGGYLLTGHSESLLGGQHSLQYICPAVYRKPLEGGFCHRRLEGRLCVR
ncbi:MAG TPA: protein-glutamate O-methyltransferase CheR [Bryobacteraceae bacterium]|nr:protein-glutamate O-methyltransferase CheR [Bryobacteraceae bacterium]HOL71185.1 protein-glutamate O-methyltransferase CheR [Bryobacteraceae bacterium]HOQ46894.1 protein-glutamate O-methyltransferase CheR [Bryobacteraceae bacterium]HPQ14352.1 protein-glutamate O-methyltransferase CheR [Bryobacteraceae bacterium]HPU73019.1 protein-glutamate O-methyltransferase CheR [Bryobacteraceae bacterium]